MKYIRTKDGRILKVFKDNVGLWQENDGLTYYGENTIDFETSCWFPKRDVAKQADTIEELCDMFVFHDMEIGMFTAYPILLPLQKHSKTNVDYEQFGAIWTDKGLIYVAKLNDKGELELL